jgi:hypothetical protein
LAAHRVQIAAPEGFSACSAAPARTISGVAGRQAGILVSIIAFQGSIALDYAIKKGIGQSWGSQSVISQPLIMSKSTLALENPAI